MKPTFVYHYTLLTAGIVPISYEDEARVTFDIHQDPHGEWAAGIGATVWDAALVLSRYLESESFPKNHFVGKRVVEIGAGTGLVGLVLASKGARVSLTDQKRCLPLLKKTVFDPQNQSVLQAARSSLLPGSSVPSSCADVDHLSVEGGCSVNILSWGEMAHVEAIRTLLEDKGSTAANPDTACDHDSPIDFLVVSDCVYWPELFEPLITSLIALCGKNTKFIMSYEERKPQSEGKFFELLEQAFEVQKVPFCKMHPDYRAPEISIIECHLRKCGRCDE